MSTGSEAGSPVYRIGFCVLISAVGILVEGCLGGTTGREDLRKPIVDASDAQMTEPMDDGEAGDAGTDVTIDRISRIKPDGYGLASDAELAADDSDGGGEAATTIRCGNGMLETGEECDDGNTLDGDGCSSFCTDTKTCDDCLNTGVCRVNMPPCVGVEGVATDGPRKGDPNIDICHDLYACFVGTGCLFLGNGWSDCYCGTSTDLCFATRGEANGRCKSKFEAAAQSTDPATISGTNFTAAPSLKVLLLAACAADNCASKCQPHGDAGVP